MESQKNRLSKYLAAAGVASRRGSEEIILEGRVTVNGQVCLMPQTPVDDNDTILVDGKSLTGAEKKVYYILHKPVGFVCSTVGGRDKTVYDLFEGVQERLFTIGRLDKDTSGLLLLTNDGQFSNRVIHPSANIHKEYLAKTDKEITPEHLLAISSGTLVEGVFVKPISVSKVRRGTVKITIAEGKKREVRQLLEAAKLNVLELCRIRIGGLHLGTIEPGTWREMTEREKELVFE